MTDSKTSTLEQLVSVTELSELLGIPTSTIYSWRHQGIGPPGVKIGRHLKYRPSAVAAWLAAQEERQASPVA